jgi:phenylacetate-CoA ligase
MPTNLAREQNEQRRWKLRPQFRNYTIFDTLVANEFLTTEERREQQQRNLQAMLRYCARRVPYYRNLFNKLKLRNAPTPDPDELALIPPITKAEIQANRAELVTEQLPLGGKFGWTTKTSGTTGPPLIIENSQLGNEMYHFLAQRSRRWDRIGPSSLAADIRQRPNLPRRPDGTPLPDGETLHRPTWPGIGHYFETGPFIGFAKSNTLKNIADWIELNQPAYIQTDSSLIEHLAFEFQSKPPLRSVLNFKAISEPMTAGQRARVEKMFGARVSQGYGLNEVGIAASTCREGYRYHVHDEHCLLEIVDDNNLPTKPGYYGRILITTLTNFAMPLLRYDTGDLAQALDGPCPCGRTLPSFGEVLGRQSRITAIPQHIRRLAKMVIEAAERTPDELSQNLRMYQVYFLSRENILELRTVSSNRLPPGFTEYMHGIWEKSNNSADVNFRITPVNDIRPAPSEKYFHFDSDLFPNPENNGH